MKEIDDEAFLGCTSLESVTISDSVEEIDEGAFSGCTSLKSVTISGSVKKIDEGAFSDCTSLTSVTIADGVKEISGGSWNYWTDSLSKGAFEGCTSLAKVSIPGSMEEIGERAFAGCMSLEVYFGGTMAQWRALKGSNKISASFVRCSDSHIGIEGIPRSLKIDGTWVTGYTGVVPAELVIPEGVTAIGNNAFKYCTSLTSVSIPSSVTEIGYNAFKNCASLENVTILGGSKKINDGAFSSCASLTSVTIADGVQTIGDDVFSGCSSLKEIQFGGTMAQWKAIQGNGKIQVSLVRCSDGNIGVEKVPEYLKMDGAKVTGYTGNFPSNLVIPDGVAEIGDGAFSGCDSLESVTIPRFVTSLGGGAGACCT